MQIRTYLRFKADYLPPEPGKSGAGEIATSLAAGLRAKGFSPSEPKDEEFAHYFRCPCGGREYEIMTAFDFMDGHTWEVSCPPRLGFFSRLLGRTEEKELSTLIMAIHDTIHANPHVKEMHWYPAYGDESNGSLNPIQDA
jgi:hypothetical protein